MGSPPGLAARLKQARADVKAIPRGRAKMRGGVGWGTARQSRWKQRSRSASLEAFWRPDLEVVEAPPFPVWTWTPRSLSVAGSSHAPCQTPPNKYGSNPKDFQRNAVPMPRISKECFGGFEEFQSLT